MNKEEFTNTRRTRHRDGRAFTGALLLLIGGVLLASKLGFPVPNWVFSWEVVLIGAGLFIGVRHRFNNPFWVIMVFVGTASLIADNYPLINIRPYIWPIAIMVLGVVFLLKPKRTITDSGNFQDNSYGITAPETASLDNRLDITAIFSGVKRRVLSKNFLGGDITSFMGGAEIDLTQADIHGRVVMDITAIFGAAKLIVPPDWDVQSQATALFGGVEDKRYVHPVINNNKVLVLDGVAMFGGIEIRSYPSVQTKVTE